MGYCTLYGDMCGGLAVIADVPKTEVFALARYLNKDSKSFRRIQLINHLPPNCVPIKWIAIPCPTMNNWMKFSLCGRRKIHKVYHAMGHASEIVHKIIRLVDINEYREAGRPALKTTPLAFGVGRRMPIVQKYQN